MLTTMRRLVRGGGAYILITLFSLPLAVVGFEWFSNETEDEKINKFGVVIIDGKDKITVNDIRRRARLLMSLHPERFQNLPQSAINEFSIGIADRFTKEAIAAKESEQYGIVPTDDLITRFIVGHPEFQKDGAFSSSYFGSLLAQQGYTALSFREMISREYKRNILLSPYSQGAFLLDAELYRLMRWYDAERDIRYRVIKLKDLYKDISLAEEDIINEHESNGDTYLSEEKVRIKYNIISVQDFHRPVRETVVQEYFQKELKRLRSSQEMSHILLAIGDERNEEEGLALAKELYDRVEAGESFADLAGTYSDDFSTKEDGGYLGLVEPQYFPNNFVEAANTLQAGNVSQPVLTDLGWHLIYLPDSADVDEDALYELVYKRTQNLRDTNIYKKNVNDLEELSLGAESLELVVATRGTEFSSVVQSDFFGREGAASGYFADTVFVELAFSEEIINGEIVLKQINDDTSIILQLDTYEPAEELDLELARPMIVDALKNSKALVTIKRHTRDLLEDIHQKITDGVDVESISDSWQQADGVKRHASGSDLDVGLIVSSFLVGRPTDDKISVQSFPGKNNIHYIVAVMEERIPDKIETERAAELWQLFQSDLGRAYTDLYTKQILLGYEIRYPSFN